MPEDRRPTFTALLELFSVIDDIGECVTFHSGLEKDLGGGVTIQRVDRNRSKVEIKALVLVAPPKPADPTILFFFVQTKYFLTPTNH